ncbi:MAG: hypothetical protein QOJ97_2412 [Solirubrobacteraceae bacterium]|nr:hypothetical protein [Solirubrobacteraceae bacterium]
MRRLPLGTHRGATAARDAHVRPPVVIRPPPVMRFFALVFTLVWCGGMIAFAVRDGWSPALILSLVLLVVGAGLGIPMLGMAAIAVGDELIVRNVYRTRRLRRSQIEGFRIGRSPIMPFGRTIHGLVPGETVALDVGLTLFRLLDGRRALEKQLEDLRSWLSVAS